MKSAAVAAPELEQEPMPARAVVVGHDDSTLTGVFAPRKLGADAASYARERRYVLDSGRFSRIQGASPRVSSKRR